MNEQELKRAVSDYLTYGQNQGKWYFDRLNSGSLLTKRGDKVYRVELCREGTADFIVMRKKEFQFSNVIRHSEEEGGETTAWFPYCEVIFLELKSEKGKQNPEQGAFQKLVEMQGARYFVVRNIEELETILGGA